MQGRDMGDIMSRGKGMAILLRYQCGLAVSNPYHFSVKRESLPHAHMYFLCRWFACAKREREEK
ncbi:unnamed protein product [Periconia digitata]|uniref:Uncharacterized protein n=1 Tax=Periconia digitata TaxID=1303443 RepID=A0A9W4XGS2_9PLEO|nr:unnamed protein product [Periconia digitata]